MFNIMQAIGKIVQIAKTITSPKQAINTALGALQKQNPQAAQMIKSAIKSGKSPVEFAKEQAANGNLNEKNLNDLRQYYGFAKKMGLPSIPEKEWTDIENAIRTNNDTSGCNSQVNGFNGF